MMKLFQDSDGTRLMHTVVALALFCSIHTLPAQAALPPDVQNTEDLDVMVEFVHKHPRVAASLRSIDVHGYSVHFGDGCVAHFGRKLRIRPPGWVGPAAPLEFKRATCEIDR